MELLSCTVQEYAWGDSQSIPHLLGEQPDGKPKAELWMGSHPRGCSNLPDGRSLSDEIGDNANATLGPELSDRFGQLPFLFKVLAAREPLSIQSHPTLEQAIEGFARENDEGIPLDAPHRVYRDANHKPELIAALTPFHAKCGFRPLPESRKLFSQLASMPGGEALEPIAERLFESHEPSEVYQNVMAYILGAPTSLEREIANATVAASHSLLGQDAAEPFRPELEWTARIAESFPSDSGVAVALLLNHIVLEPGEAVFLQAGNLHAYLSGVGMEVMANSDNVVRGGLTPKHRDVAELLRVVDCSPIDVPIQQPGSDTWTYESPVPEFTLDRIIDPEGYEVVNSGPEILFVQQGSVELVSTSAQLTARAGQVVWIPASEGDYRLTGATTVWRART